MNYSIGLSKKMAYILRHSARKLGLDMDAGGWVKLDDLLACLNENRHPDRQYTMDDIIAVVKYNDKQRFAISGDKIRASQGHSLKVELGLVSREPPVLLYHGTAVHLVNEILRDGLKKMGRNHVHLSWDVDTAMKVGRRHGKPTVLKIDAKKMFNDEYKFFLSENGVWLVDHVPPRYISTMEL
ncbi:MAG: RNA 2'-phosphotransferase [Promethearchaeota archaeon]